MDNKKDIDKLDFLNQETDNVFCRCNAPSSVTSDTESSDFGYWLVCCDCGKRLENEFHEYNHYDGEDHDDIDLYCEY